MTANNRKTAWEKADIIFPTDYAKDERRSERAGYDIYYSTAQGVNAWISDLEDRLEINLENGETVNIFIEDEPQFKEYQIEDALSFINDTIYEIDDKINHKLADVVGITEAREKLIGAYEEIAKILKKQHPESKLIKRYGLDK